MDPATQPTTLWFDRRLVMRASPIHGAGVFTLEPIGPGEVLTWVTGGFVYTADDYHSGRVVLEAELYNEARLPDGRLIATPKALAYFVNHSCAPNAVERSEHGAWQQYVALREIAAGEEITADYLDATRLAACNCGSGSCRW
jgi:SET domain-containing protein